MKILQLGIMKNMRYFFLAVIIQGFLIASPPTYGQNKQRQDSINSRKPLDIEAGRITAVINGVKYKMANDSLIKVKAVRANVNTGSKNYMIEIYGTTEDFLNQKKTIRLVLFGKNTNKLTAGKQFNGIWKGLDTEGVSAAYYNTGNITANLVTTESIQEVRVKITNIDFELKILSGKFSFKGVNQFDKKEFVVSDGYFMNVPFETQTAR